MFIEPRAATDPAVLEMTAAMAEELAERYPDADVEFADYGPYTRYVVAVVDGEPIGCGAVSPLEPGVGELKAIYVRPRWRGQGVGRRIVSALEARARAAGWHTVRLEAGARQPEALALYASAGYLRLSALGSHGDGEPQSRGDGGLGSHGDGEPQSHGDGEPQSHGDGGPGPHPDDGGQSIRFTRALAEE